MKTKKLFNFYPEFNFIKKVLCLLSFPVILAIPTPSFSAPLPNELKELLIDQVTHELDGANFYLQLASEFNRKGLDGFGKWFTVQYYEEINHSRMIMDFLKKKNVQVALKPISAPPFPKLDVQENVKDSYSLEELQTERIQKLYSLARELRASDAENFLAILVNEQVTEEDLFADLQAKVEMVTQKSQGLYLLDRELKLRPLPVIFMPIIQ